MTWLSRFGVWTASLQGWRRLLFAFAAGLVSAAAFAPLYFFPALLLGFAVLALLLDGVSIRAAALTGWAFAFGQFLIGLHWIGYAFMVDPGAHLWQLPFAVTLLPLGLGLFGAAATAAAASFRLRGPARLLALAICYAVCEWLRGHILTGLPWNLPGYGWGASVAILQSTSLMGIYGLSLLTILLGVSLAELVHRRFALPAAMILVFAGLFVFGTVRLTTPSADVADVLVRLVQPNIPQREKHDRALLARNWSRLVTLTQSPAQAGPPTHIIWPESAPPFPLARVPQAMDVIAVLTAGGKVLMTGTERIDRSGAEFAYYNSLYIFGPGAKALGVYDKSHLVPFGEYVPFASLLNRIGITKLTVGQAGFSSGDGPRVYGVPGAPAMTPLICYEVIFPGAVVPTRGARPGWFVNVTDDSWFGPWAGPYQHLLIAQVRAIEEGMPIARAANTGISAMIDPFGRIRAQLALDREGVVDARLPRALSPPLYARMGDLGFALLLLLTTVLSVFWGRARGHAAH